jgi:hypothetical protein
MNYLKNIYNIFIKKNIDSKKNDDKEYSHTCDSSSYSEYTAFLPKRKQVKNIKDIKEDDALIVDDIEMTVNKETPSINIRGKPGIDSFEIHRIGTDCYLSEHIFYTEFINAVTCYPEYRKATSISWPNCIPKQQTALFSRDMDIINMDIINTYYVFCKNKKLENKVTTFMEESIREDTPWKIERLNFIEM